MTENNNKNKKQKYEHPEKDFLDFLLTLTDQNEHAAEHIIGCKECKSALKKIIKIKIKDRTKNIFTSNEIDVGLFLVKQHLVAAGIILTDVQHSFSDLAGDPLQ